MSNYQSIKPDISISYKQCIDHFNQYPFLLNDNRAFFHFNHKNVNQNNSINNSGYLLAYHQKTGSTFLMGLLKTAKELIGNKVYNAYNYGINRVYRNHKQQFIDLYCNHSSIQNNFYFITIVRDPMNKLLSAFLDKCTTIHSSFVQKKPGNPGHIACKVYLEEIQGIDVYNGLSKQEYKERKTDIDKNITFYSFLKWLNNAYNITTQKNVDSHFRNYRFNSDLQFYHPLFKVFNLKHKLIWYWVGRMMINLEDNINETITNQFNEIFYEKFETKHRPKKTGSGTTDMINKYFENEKIIYLALQWTFMDYLIFDITIPDWICNHYDDNIKQLLHDKFSRQKYLLPQCAVIDI